jgi:acetyl-CoA C-acetyltransferase
MTTSSVLVAGARTPIGKLLGSLTGFSASDLGGIAIKGALDKSGLTPEQVQYVIMGQVLTAGAGQNPARQAAVAAGIPMNVPAITINKLCLSGLNAIALADQLIRAGELDIVVAGGQESMTRAPHILEKSRQGFKFGDVTLADHLAYDGLHDVFTDQAMGALTESHNTGPVAVSREDQDTFAAASHHKAAQAWRNGCSTTKWCRWRSRNAAANPSCSSRTKGSGRTPRSSHWPGSGRPSTATGPSPRDRHPNCPTARPR